MRGRPRLHARSPLGEALYQVRVRRGWTQQQAAALVGLSSTHLRKLEGGQRQPSLPALRRLAAAYGVRPADLLRLAEKFAKNFSDFGAIDVTSGGSTG